MGDAPFRILPRVNDENRYFWTSARTGGCASCGATTAGSTSTRRRRSVPSACRKQLAVDAGERPGHRRHVHGQPPAVDPGLDPPYVVAIVEIDEQPSVRLTTNIVGCAPDDVRIGMPVQVTFEHHDDVWLPFFEPVANDVIGATRSASARPSSPASGSPTSAAGCYRTGLDLTVDAALAAIADAGLTRDDIDGIATYPGQHGHAAGLLRRRRQRGAGRAAAQAQLAQRRAREPGAARAR